MRLKRNKIYPYIFYMDNEIYKQYGVGYIKGQHVICYNNDNNGKPFGYYVDQFRKLSDNGKRFFI